MNIYNITIIVIISKECIHMSLLSVKYKETWKFFLHYIELGFPSKTTYNKRENLVHFLVLITKGKAFYWKVRHIFV